MIGRYTMYILNYYLLGLHCNKDWYSPSKTPCGLMCIQPFHAYSLTTWDTSSTNNYTNLASIQHWIKILSSPFLLSFFLLIHYTKIVQRIHSRIIIFWNRFCVNNFHLSSISYPPKAFQVHLLWEKNVPIENTRRALFPLLVYIWYFGLLIIDFFFLIW